MYMLGDTQPTTTPTFSLPEAVDSQTVKTGAMVALTYHGYRRTGSLFWALVYGLAGRWKPVIAVPVAIAQGFGEKKPCSCP